MPVWVARISQGAVEGTGAVARCRVGHHFAPALAGEGSREGSCSAAGFGGLFRPWSRGPQPLPHLPAPVGLSVPRLVFAFLSGGDCLLYI